MKHIFIINPKAGKVDKKDEILSQLEEFKDQIDYEIYFTKCPGDGNTFTKNYLETHDEKEVYRFYACGGDGSLHDVVNGAMGHKNVEVACYPSGSGNDFIKNFGAGPEFKSIKSQILGTAQPVDILKINDSYCINIINFGFDGEVNDAMLRLKRLPLVSGPMAYNLGVVKALLFKMSNHMKLTIDDEVAFEGRGTLCAIANGQVYGGGFKCAPKAEINDGIIDVCFVKRISRFKAAPFVKVYKAGEHVECEALQKYLIYRKCKKVLIESNKCVCFGIDGETQRVKEPHLLIEVIPNGLNFVVPKKL